MSRSVLHRAPEPFFTTKDPGQGTGLGLAISYALVENMGGSLTFESDPGHGTTATLRLPAAAGWKLPEAQETGPEPTRTGLDILIVDDEDDIRDLCTEFLCRRHTVRAASDGAVALDLIGANTPDLVLCDLVMSPMGGVELYRRACTLHPEVANRFVFMTGAAELPDSRSFLDEHGGLVLLKPFTLSRITEVIEEAGAADRSAPSTSER